MTAIYELSKEDVRYRSREMQDSMPTYYSESPEAIAIMDANATEIERKKAEAASLQAQLFVESATWGLSYWERVLALPPRPNTTLEFRRNRIIARLNGTAPATVAYLTEVVNANVSDKSARIVEYNGEYRFEAEIPVDQLRNTGIIYREINDVKPAHLAFGITGMISETITIGERAYGFGVPYPVTNKMRTDDVKGGLARMPITLHEKTDTFEVVYPITNVLTVEGMAARFADGVGFSATANSNRVKYARVGTATASSGNRMATLNASYDGDITTVTNATDVLYPRVGNATVRKGTE